MIRGDFHVHTTFCDGADTPAAMAEAALKAGFTHIGFSAHAPTPCDRSYCLPPEREADYRRAVEEVRAAYAGRLTVLLGLEQDLYAQPAVGYDYLIGSVHYIPATGYYIPVDESADLLQRAVDYHFGGDYYTLAEKYFANVAKLADLRPDIIGHFDLIQKFNAGDRLFSSDNPRYVAAAEAALEALLPLNVPFEINTGAIFRGVQTVPYPAARWLRYIGERGGRVILSGDAHCAAGLGFRFAEAAALAAACGCPVVDSPFA